MNRTGERSARNRHAPFEAAGAGNGSGNRYRASPRPYCNVCGERILESDFKKGKAVTVQKKNYCPKCAKDVVQESQEKEAIPSTSSRPHSSRKLETRRIPLADQPYRPGGKFPIPVPFMIAIGVGVLALLLLILVLSRSGH